MKIKILIILSLFSIRLSYSQCSTKTGAVYNYIAPPEPTSVCTTPTGTALPSNTTTLPLAAATFPVSYRVVGGDNLTITSFALNSGNTMNLYVCPGAKIQFNQWNINTGAVLNVYVLTNATLTFNTALTRGNIYVYGKMSAVITPTFSIQNSALISIAQGGLIDATNTRLDLTSSTVGIFNSGGSIFAEDMTMQSSNAPVFCTINGGCTYVEKTFANTVVDAIFSDASGGFLSLPATTGSSLNQLVSSSANLTVCKPGSASYSCSAPGCTGNSPWPNASVTTSCGSGGSASCNIALPVSLLYFNSQKSNGGVILNWATEKQWDSDYFIVETSTTGIDWHLVGTVESEKNNQTLTTYSLIDPSPKEGINYYRLSEVDTKGKKTIYSVSMTNVENELGDYSIFPNPGIGILNVRLHGDGIVYDFEVTDLSGKKISKLKLKSGLTTLEDLFPSPGVYIATIKIGHEVKTEKIIVQ